MINNEEYEAAKKSLNELIDITVDDPRAEEWDSLLDKITRYENEVLDKE